MGTFVGIDLGTTFSAVAYIDSSGRAACIPNAYNKNITPSVIYLGPDEVLVGEEAKQMQTGGETEVASFFKRVMGDENAVQIFHGKTYRSEDLSALLLMELKRTAESFLKKPVTHAVITVPAYFTNPKREATMRAGQKAGLEVLSIISEPTAAALAFGVRPQAGKGEQTVVVYDLGGGTFDVSIVRITPDEQIVLGTGGDSNLGGKDWDDRIFMHVKNQFVDEFAVDLTHGEKQALLTACEAAKISLSAQSSVKVRVQAGGYTGNYTITRQQFEEMTCDLIERTQMLIEQTLREVKLEWSEVNQVLLVGGATRMPMVKQLVERMSGKAPSTAVHPDEAVALGAAIQAAMDMERLSPSQSLFTLSGRKKSTDVISHSLGLIATNEDNSRYVNSIIICKNQPIPCSMVRPYSLPLSARRDNTLEIYLTQSEVTDPTGCAYLGKYVFSGLPRVNNPKAIIDICYAYDQNGIVNISAVERDTRTNLPFKREPLPEDIPYRFTLPPRQESLREHMNVYLAFDLSGSMSGEPLAEAKRAAHAFIAQCDLSSTSAGLIGFSDSVHLQTQATQNGNEIARGIDGLSCGQTGYGNDGDPFDMIYQLLHKAEGNRYALVLADGVWSNQELAIKRAQRCHAEGIGIIGVGFGGADEDFLRKISSCDENSFFTDLSHLTETFSTIAQELTEGRSPSGKGGLVHRG